MIPRKLFFHGYRFQRCCLILLIPACFFLFFACSHSPATSSPTALSDEQYQEMAAAFAARDYARLRRELIQLKNEGIKDKRALYLEALMNLNNPENAKPLLLEALRLDPQYSEAHNALGVIYVQEKQYPLAETEFVKAVSNPLYVTPEKAYQNLGNLYREQGKEELALACYRKALKYNLDYFPAHYELARYYFRQKELRAALKEINQARELSPKHPGVWLLIGEIEELRDNPGPAREAYKKVLELQPVGVFADQARQKLKELPPAD
jgi:type IV pilus assembly protein PilF